MSRRQSTADNLADILRLFGGTVTGDETTAQLLDALEKVVPQGGSPSQEVLARVLEEYLAGQAGELSDEDMDEVFGE